MKDTILHPCGFLCSLDVVRWFKEACILYNIKLLFADVDNNFGRKVKFI